jgi:ubiquinone/menaquinone biosynthesis C-methylase UbiE
MSDDEVRQAEFAERMLGGLTASAEILAIDLGRRLGLYQALAGGVPTNSERLSVRAGIAERYALEWLEQQAAAGVLDAVHPDAGRGEPSTEREFVLPAALEPLLLDPEHPLHVMGVPPSVASLAATLPLVAHAYRTGGGVPYPAFGPEMREGISALNRPGFANDLRSWVDSVPDVAARLDAGGTALDAGCGLGWSTIALARAFPHATVVGVDLDEASVTAARANAVAGGLDESRVRFETVDAAAAREGSVDLVTVFEALHDMGEPVRALESFRRALIVGGAVLVADEKVAPEFTAPASEVERMQFAFSVLHCLPATMAESASVANGTILREPTVRRWAAEAGFTRVEVLPVEHEFWRFYRLD